MGLSFGLERGQVTSQDLAKARTMVPRALEQYVVQLAEKGPGNCSSIPKVSPPKILKEEIFDQSELAQSEHGGDTDSEVDIN